MTVEEGVVGCVDSVSEGAWDGSGVGVPVGVGTDISDSSAGPGFPMPFWVSLVGNSTGSVDKGCSLTFRRRRRGARGGNGSSATDNQGS